MTQRINKPDTPADIELRAYLEAEERPCFVMVAGAGSGKTTSLVKALDRLGKVYGAELRRNNQQVACITYTEVASGEIWGDVGHDSLFHVSTIHSFLWTLVKSFPKDIRFWVRQRLEEKLADLAGKRITAKSQRETAKLTRQLAVIDQAPDFRYEGAGDYAKGLLGHDDIIRMVPQLIQERPLLQKIIARQYPFFFVDESQDTVPGVVQALRAVAQANKGSFSLGFFGDPMQKIYATGVGAIALDPDWKEIKKPENFRCPTNVLAVINKIRTDIGDGLEQTKGRHEIVDGKPQPVSGTAKLFVLPADGQRSQNLDRVRTWLAETSSDPHWVKDSPEADIRILVIEHRMAAKRLGFLDLFSAFKDRDQASESLRSSFTEGKAWPLKPILEVLVPLCFALRSNQQFEVMRLLRKHSPCFQEESIAGTVNPVDLLVTTQTNLTKLAALLSPDSSATILEVLEFADHAGLIRLEDRLKSYVDQVPDDDSRGSVQDQSAEDDQESEEKAKDIRALVAFLACPAPQVWGYHTYLNRESPYSTQHGVKGAEFERVIVVLDDEEGNYSLFSYDKLLGLQELSATDKTNKEEGKESVLDRTSRLLYVCSSRATRDLAVVLYAADVPRATDRVKEHNWFQPNDIHTLEDIS